MLGVLLAVAVLGCTPPLDSRQDQRLAGLTLKRIERYSEWRNVWRVPAGSSTLNLGTVPEQGGPFDPVLRLAVLEGEPHGETARIRVYLGDRCVEDWRTGQTPRWAAYRVPLGEGKAGEVCRVVVDSPQIVWIGPCEVVWKAAPAPNVLIYLIDTVRLDHLTCYGYTRDTSPNLDQLAGEGLLFTQFMPQSSWTRPSVASLLTSTYPNIHGAQDRPDVLRPGLPSLAQALAQNGYETHGFMTNVNCLPLWGFGDDFFRYVNVDAEQWLESADDAKVVDRARETLAHVKDRPWFLYVHTMGPHDPYEPPGGYDTKYAPAADAASEEERKRQQDIALYDGEIAYSDLQFGRLVDTLRTLGLYENTLIIVLSDHGEEFWEHGDIRHGKTLYEEVLRVPFIVKMPGGDLAGQRREALVEAVDVAPTVLEILGLPPEPRFQGRSFLTLLHGTDEAKRTGYASLVDEAHSARTAKTVQHKFIRDLARGQDSWFDLTADPAEQRPLAETPAWGHTLAAHAMRMAMQGAQGLHLLMTCGDVPRQVTGVVEGAALGDQELRYYDWKGTAQREGNRVTFDLLTHHPEDHARDRDKWHREHAEQDNAHLFIPMPADAPVSVSVRVDGQPLSLEDTLVGRDRQSRPLDGTPLDPVSLVADPDDFDPAALPRRFAVYVWYVTDVDNIEVSALDPQVRDALGALGYLE